MPKIAYRLKTITLVILFALASTQLFAQVPTILSFSPQKGKYHDIDTINGNGFHTNVDSNFVFFGKVRAKVISATLNKLIVEIPRSAQSGPITITKGGLTTKSISEFIIYKEGGNYLDNTVLSNAGWIGSVSSDPLMSENQLVSGDFNLDGEIDIIETDVWGGSRLFINNKTYQMATSFSSFINLADNTGSKILGTADINNDGKMDIVSINKQYRKIYYFKNTSTTNAFSIDAPLVFNLQNSPRDFTINDFNNDGKLDLAITYDSIFSGTAGTSILLNISTNLDSLLFSSPISISGNYKGSKILSTDFNLDGKQDLIVSPISGTSQAVFLNNSSTSAVIFTPFSFSMNSMDKLFIGNVTLDGKPDIILHDGSYTIRIYENNVSGFTGSIDYYSYFNLNHINAPFNNVKYADINMDGFSDFIVYNSNYGRTTIYLQAKVPNAFNKRDFSLSTFFSSPNTTNNLILADLDSNYSQDMISFTNGLQLTRNDFFKPQPTIKSSNANIISLESFMAKCTVNKGNGSKRMVLLKKGTPITQLPVDYTIYAVKDSFGLGTLLEPDCYAMYIGNKDTFTFNNLRRKTRYYGAIIEFNGNDSGANFMDSAAYFDFQTKDQISTPATNLVVSSISDSSARISWTKGDGTHRLVLVSRGSDIPELVNFKTYRADNNFGYGDTLMNKYGYPACIVYADTGSFFDLNELSVSTKYYIRIIEYEIKTDSIYYSKLYSGSLFTWFFNTPKKIPRIDSIVPIKARPGDKVMIYGDNFDYDIFTNKVSYLLAKYNADISTAVTFGALKATEFNIVNKRLIEVIVPYGVTNDFVRVTRRFIGDSYSPKKFQPYFISKDTFGAGTYGSLNTIGIGWHSTTDSLNGIGVGDIDGNGKVRFLIQSGTGIMRTYGDGYYSDTYQLTTYGIVGQYVDGYSTGLTSHRTIEMNFDKDIDLDPDFIATSFSSWQNTAQKSILGSTDFNKDGKYDFLFIDADYNNFFNNRSIGIKMGTDDYLNWSINWNSGTQLLRASAINDFNNDGRPDIVSANYLTGKIRIYRNIYDTGVFSKNSFDSTLAISGPSGWERLESGDIDGDGREDIAITNSINNKLYIYKNVSTGVNLDSNSFTITGIFSLPCKPNRVRLQDVSGDGKIDLIVSGNNTSGSGLVIYKNNSINGNMDTNSFVLCSTTHNSNGGDLKIADINLDGKPEIIYNSYSNSDLVIVNSSQRLFAINQLKKRAYLLGDTLRLSYNTFGRIFNVGNICRVQLLDSTGNLIINTNIGQKTSTLSTDTILCILPVSIPYGSYKLRVVSTSIVDTSTISDFNIGVCQSGQVINLSSSKGFNVCSYDSINLVAGISNAGSFKWFRNNAFVDITTNSNTLKVKLPGQYKVNYTSPLGCLINTNTVQVNSVNNSFSGYTINRSLVFCEGDSVIVTANSTKPNNKTNWYLNNNLLQADSFASIKIKQSGIYKSIIIDSNLCSWNTPTFNVNSNDYKVRITVNKSLFFCNGDSATLIADSMGNTGLKWRWLVNNLLLPDSNSNLKMYSSGLVKLKATNSNGCINYSNDTQVVVYPAPIANFIINNPIQCLTGNNLSFTDSSTIASGTLSRKWNFGNGIADTSSASNPNKTYLSSNNYSVKLVSTSNNGCRDSLLKSVSINPQPGSIIKVVGNTTFCANKSLTLKATTGIGKSYSWLKNGLPILVNNDSNLLVTTQGSYKLITKNNFNCIDTSLSTDIIVNPIPKSGFTINTPMQCFIGNSFSFTDTSIISSGNISRLWSLGGGDTSINIYANKVFANVGTYSIKLVSVGDGGCKDSVTKIVTVFPQPKAGFTINNTIQCLKGNNFLFNDTSKVVSGTITRKWYFGTGDNDTSVLISPNKNYSNANSYFVKLISISNNNCKDSITKTVTVNSNAIANFNINDSSQCLTGNNFVFTNSSTNSNSQTWNFGDASNSAVLSPTKTYNTIGNFVVKLVANNINSCKDSIAKTVIVNAQPTIGTITGSNTPNSITSPFTYSILNQANTTYNWSVINGTIQTGQGTNTIDVIWPITGTGSLNAKITNSNGCSDSTSLPVNITSVGVNEFVFNSFTNINFKPNPFSDELEIQFTSLTKKEARLTIIDALGKVAYVNKLDNLIVGENIIVLNDVSNLKGGIYFAYIENEEGKSKPIKIIKN